MSDQEKKAAEKKEKQVTTWLIIGGIIVILLLVWVFSPTSTSTTAARSVQQPTVHRLELDTLNYKGFVFIPGGCRIDWMLETPHAWVRVKTRSDMPDNQALLQFPQGWEPGSHLEITNDYGRCYSWKLESNPEPVARLAEKGLQIPVATRASLLYVVSPISSGPYWRK